VTSQKGSEAGRHTQQGKDFLDQQSTNDLSYVVRVSLPKMAPCIINRFYRGNQQTVRGFVLVVIDVVVDDERRRP
jgi:hypothetical protein